MASKEGLDYIKQQLAAGVDSAALRSTMIENGWQASDVDEMLSQFNQKTSNQPLNSITKRFPFALIIIATLIILLIGSYFLFFSPTRVLATTLTKSANIKSFNYEINVQGQATTSSLNPSIGGVAFDENQAASSQKSESDFSFDASGQADFFNGDNLKISSKIDVNTGISDKEKKAYGGEIRLANKTLYYKFDNVPDGVIVDLSSLMGQWVVMSAVSSEAQKAAFSLNKDQIAKLVLAYQKNQFFAVQDGTKIEVLNGNLVYHYRFTLNQKKLEGFLGSYQEILGLKSFSPSEIASAFPAASGEFWAGIFDAKIYSLRATFSSQEQAGIPVAGHYNLVFDLANFDRPTSISVPTNTLDAVQVGRMLSAQIAALQIADKDKDGLTDFYEKIWKTNSDKADTDGDGHGDFSEICNGFDPLTVEKLSQSEMTLPKPSACKNTTPPIN